MWSLGRADSVVEDFSKYTRVCSLCYKFQAHAVFLCIFHILGDIVMRDHTMWEVCICKVRVQQSTWTEKKFLLWLDHFKGTNKKRAASVSIVENNHYFHLSFRCLLHICLPIARHWLLFGNRLPIAIPQTDIVLPTQVTFSKSSL